MTQDAPGTPSPPPAATAGSTSAATAGAATTAPALREPLRSQQVSRLILGVVIVVLAVYTLHDFLPALAWAAIFAIATWPLFRRCQRAWGMGRHNILTPALFTLAIALIFIVPITLLAVEAGRDAHGVLTWIDEARHHGIPAPPWLDRLPVGHDRAVAWWNDNLRDPDAASDLLERMHQGNAIALSRSIGSQIAHRGTLFAFTLLTLFFLFKEGDTVTRQMLVASRRVFGRRGESIGQQVIASIHGTVDGLILVGLGEGVILGIAYVVAGVPHPALLGAASAVAAMVPFCVFVALALAAALALVKGSVVAAIVLFAFGMVIIFVADHFVRPVLIGGATRLPFVWVLLGILGGVETWGLLGLFLGPAIMAALIMLWREWTEDSHVEPDQHSE